MGGAWKVAYADLVTGMFALFLCLWITSVDEEVMSEISKHFTNPNKETAQTSPGTIDAIISNVASSRRPSFTKPALVPKRAIRKTTENIEKSYVQSPELENENMHVEVIDEGVKFSLFGTSQKPIFDGPNEGLSEYGNIILDSLSTWLSRKHDIQGKPIEPMEIEIEGFAPEDSDEDHWTASINQAMLIRKKLKVSGVPENYIKKVVGYGDRRKPSITGNEDDQSVSIIIRNKK